MNTIKTYRSLLLVLIFVAMTQSLFAQLTPSKKEPWKPDQLMAPAHLAEIIKDTKLTPPVIISVSPAPVIPGSIDIGPTNDKANMEKLKEQLKSIPRDADLVIYCGCCPFDKCPNVRPAFNLLNELGYTNHKLLDIPNNIKIDWINKGYPVVKLK